MARLNARDTVVVRNAAPRCFPRFPHRELGLHVCVCLVGLGTRNAKTHICVSRMLEGPGEVEPSLPSPLLPGPKAYMPHKGL